MKWYRNHLRLIVGPSSSFNDWRDYSLLGERTSEFLWRQVLPGLRTQVQKKPPAPSNPLHVIGDVNLPDKVRQVLKCGPKFAVEPRKSSPELLGMVRNVSKQVPEGDVDSGLRPCLDKLTIPPRRLPGHADTIRASVRTQAGPPGPFKSTKRRGAALTLTHRACTSTMQRPAQHSSPMTTDALSISPASSGRTADTAMPPLSTSGNVTSPAPTTVQQQAAFLNSAHGPATCNAGGVSATPSSIATQTPEPENPDDLSTEIDFTASQVNEDNTAPPEGSWNAVSANRKPASTSHPRSELITVGIQLPPGTLTLKLPLYDLLATIIAAANLFPKTSAEGTALINAPNTAFRPSAAAVRLLYQQITMLTFAHNPGASIAKSTPTHLSTPPAPTF
ncbi:hypothetical protein HPB51_024783 [Rhipicephalus microplus]|uniref:Uncharacterized protein n=1 Tax=Rhipicephalus microplus TaxID=6941 RepID=A0A9J6D7P5_RHIMP|nr:hypothetical protein HPB51_024783 [Rhipicephalus microplus]